MVVNDTAVGANGNINSLFFKVFVTGFTNLDKGGSLTAADTLGFAGNTDGATADTNLYKVGAAIGKKTEAFSVNNVTCADFYRIAVIFAYPFDGALLPLGKAF